MMESINKNIAQGIINAVGGPGVPPEYGFQYFTAGLDEYLDPIGKEYISSWIKDGGGTFKMVVDTYGGGKTHFLYCIRELAWQNEFAVSYVELKIGETPFFKLESVYKSIASNLSYPQSPPQIISKYEKGTVSFIEKWFERKKQELKRKGIRGRRLKDELRRYALSIPTFESISFTQAVRNAFLCLEEGRRDDLYEIMQWLQGEGYDKGFRRFGILQKIDKGTAFQMIRSLVRWVREIGYSGLVVLLDEAERESSISGKQQTILLTNLRELINESAMSGLANSMFFYAVPDEDFLEGRTKVYEAVRQRVSSVFSEQNPVGVKILLENISREPEDILCEIGQKLAAIFEIYSQIKFNTRVLEESITNIANAAWEERFGETGYKRLFVQAVVEGFKSLQRQPMSIITPDKARELIPR